MSKEAGRLIIENIGAIQEAYLLLSGELSEQVFKVVDQTIESWAQELGWEGQFSFWESDDDTWFCPSQWLVSDDQTDKPVAWFAIDTTNTNNKEWLTALLGAGEERICFSFNIARDSVGLRKTDWKKLAVQQNQQMPQSVKVYFQFDATEGTWSLPWKIDAKALADGYVNDTMEDAMGPLKDALERIKSVFDAFDQVVKAARQQGAA